MAFRGPILCVDRQRELFQRWSTGPEVHPHEPFFGLAACYTAPAPKNCSISPTRTFDHDRHRIRLGRQSAEMSTESW
jgi:hypothetical protein